MPLDPNSLLDRLREAFATDDPPRAFLLFRELDTHLSGGGIPPEEWREGPDAPGSNGETWGWQGDPRADDAGTPDDVVERPAPEGLAVFAHWSAAHDGINVEIDLPDGPDGEPLPLTVHVNDGIVFRHGDTDSRIAEPYDYSRFITGTNAAE